MACDRKVSTVCAKVTLSENTTTSGFSPYGKHGQDILCYMQGSFRVTSIISFGATQQLTAVQQLLSSACNLQHFSRRSDFSLLGKSVSLHFQTAIVRLNLATSRQLPTPNRNKLRTNSSNLLGLCIVLLNSRTNRNPVHEQHWLFPLFPALGQVYSLNGAYRNNKMAQNVSCFFE